ncbi:hypothetical protein DYB32_001267 [Aphanomyces invadans]|uniref:Uncharacterized protein n=1 Tax=Aphanomyces invadans TaxID=157072 RepID=A0A3R6VGM5_9STRA|nr:hypothetical protein DYB32_001267 [Aphanomyces invadans]
MAAPRWKRSAWLHATDVLASTLRGYISLQKKHQDELRTFASKACGVLEEAAVGSESLRGVLTHVSELFAHAASAPEELCVNLPLDLDELQTELQRQVDQMECLVQETNAQESAFNAAKQAYASAWTAFNTSFTQSSELLARAIDCGIDPNLFLDVDDASAIQATQTSTTTTIPPVDSSPTLGSKKIVRQVADAIRRAKSNKATCIVQYKLFRKVAGEYAQALDTMTATQQVRVRVTVRPLHLVQAIERESSTNLTSIVHKFIVCYLSLVKNLEVGRVEAEQNQMLAMPPRFVGHAAAIHEQMQAMPPPLGEPLELSYFLEQYFPTTQVRPLLVRHQPRTSLFAA